MAAGFRWCGSSRVAACGAGHRGREPVVITAVRWTPRTYEFQRRGASEHEVCPRGVRVKTFGETSENPAKRHIWPAIRPTYSVVLWGDRMTPTLETASDPGPTATRGRPSLVSAALCPTTVGRSTPPWAFVGTRSASDRPASGRLPDSRAVGQRIFHLPSLRSRFVRTRLVTARARRVVPMPSVRADSRAEGAKHCALRYVWARPHSIGTRFVDTLPHGPLSSCVLVCSTVGAPPIEAWSAPRRLPALSVFVPKPTPCRTSVDR